MMTFQFDWFSIVFAIILVFYVILGIAKGFGHMFLNFVLAVIFFVASLVLASLFGQIIGNAIGLNSLLGTPIQSFLDGMSEVFQINNPGRELVAQAISSNDYSALTNLQIPAFLGPLFLALVLPNIPTYATETPISQYITESFVSAIAVLATFVVIYMALSVIHEIIKARIRKKQRKARKEGIYKKPNFVSRILGAVLGFVVAAVTIYFILWIFKVLLMQVEQIRALFTNFWALDNSNVMTIGKFLYTNNPFNDALIWIFSLFGI